MLDVPVPVRVMSKSVGYCGITKWKDKHVSFVFWCCIQKHIVFHLNKFFAICRLLFHCRVSIRIRQAIGGLDTPARTLIQSMFDQVSSNDSPYISTFDGHNNILITHLLQISRSPYSIIPLQVIPKLDTNPTNLCPLDHPLLFSFANHHGGVTPSLASPVYSTNISFVLFGFELRVKSRDSDSDLEVYSDKKERGSRNN